MVITPRRASAAISDERVRMTVSISGTEVRAGLLRAVEHRLRDQIDTQRARWCAVDPRADQPIGAVADLLGSGGKRLRPVFCLTGFLAVGGDPADPDIVDAAAALELLQAFALLHDDVLDDSMLRRG